MKRIRALTEAERAIWAQVAATVTQRLNGPSTRDDLVASVDQPHTETLDRDRVAKAAPKPPAALPKPELAVPPALAPIERRLKQRLSRGQRTVDAKIDLHGMRQDEAHAALHRFLASAHARGAGLVLIVTGKGGRKSAEERSFGDFTQGERGVLHRLAPLWLADPEMRRFVIGFEQAAQGHGGSGALYVRIRRAR